MKKFFSSFFAERAADILIKLSYILFFFIFTITLFGVVFIGNRLDYYEAVKLEYLLDNTLTFAAAIVTLSVWIFIGFFLQKIPASKTLDRLTVVFILLSFVGLYFISNEISKCIAFYTGWDVSIVSGTAYNLKKSEPIADFWYYSVYPNNVPVAYILYRVYTWAENCSSYACNGEFAWLQLNNLLICISGFTSCLTVRRLTHELFPVFTCFLLFIGSVFVSPWRIIPYTDIMAIAFPILAICFYIYSSTATTPKAKYIYFTLSCLTAALGGLIKPPVLLMLIAVAITEILSFAKRNFRCITEILTKILILMCVLFISSSYKEYIYTETGFIHNQEISATYHHYFLMGLNEESTGGYYSDDVALFGRYDTAEERIDVEMELAFDRIREKGVFGYPYFLFKKCVMCFNDGTFGWYKEGGFYFQPFQELTTANYKQFLRDIFWSDARYSGRFNTYSQLSWFIILAGILGNALYLKSDQKHVIGSLIISLLGVMLYLMLFEARARYLLCFLPVWCTASSLGIYSSFEYIRRKIKLKKKKG